MLRAMWASASTPVAPQQLRLEPGVLNAADEKPGPSDVRVVLDLSLASQEIHCRFLRSSAASALPLDPAMEGKGCPREANKVQGDLHAHARLIADLQPCHHAAMLGPACPLGTGLWMLSNALALLTAWQQCWALRRLSSSMQRIE